jgi:HSP20 family protein
MTDQGGGSTLDFQRHLDEIFDRMIYRRWSIPNPAEWRPRIDLHETGDSYYIEVDLPGVPPERVEIRVADGCVTITGTRPRTSLEGVFVSHRERECGSFRRSLSLPQAVSAERVHSEYHHGTYQIRLFKVREAALPAQEKKPSDPEKRT